MKQAFKTAYEIVRERMRQSYRRPLPPARPIGPSVMLREMEIEDVLRRIRDRAVESVAVHNAHVIHIETRRSLRGEVLGLFTPKARSLAR